MIWNPRWWICKQWHSTSFLGSLESKTRSILGYGASFTTWTACWSLILVAALKMEEAENEHLVCRDPGWSPTRHNLILAQHLGGGLGNVTTFASYRLLGSTAFTQMSNRIQGSRELSPLCTMEMQMKLCKSWAARSNHSASEELSAI